MLAPSADRLERLGINRTVAALLIVGIFVAGADRLVTLLLVPLLVQQGAALISHIPGYFKRVKELHRRSESPLAGLARAPASQNKTVSDLVGQVATWLLSFAYSIWTGGKALVSLAVDPDRDAGRHFLLDLRLAPDDRDSGRLGAAAPARDRCANSPARSTRRSAGFVRGQLGVCLVLGCYYAIGLMLAGLDFALLIGLDRRR